MIEVLKSEIQDFINNNLNEDITKLALRKNPFPEIDFAVILNQIAAKSKARDKLPTWFQQPNIIFPTKISVEQTSSEKTAAYKASLISGTSLIDLTGGFGVDDFYFSKTFKTVVHCELNEELSQIVAHNFKVMQAENIFCEIGDSLQTLKQSNQKFDWIYVDPSRRNNAKGKVFMLADCLPNVPELLDEYFRFSENILMKTAPILDISAGLSELKNVEKIYVVALENEVKELLWKFSKNYTGEITIETVNLQKNGDQLFSFGRNSEERTSFGLPQKFLYEPNAAILKSGGYNHLSEQFAIQKLHQHSHLFTSQELIMNFPGRIFSIQSILPYNKLAMKQHLAGKKANITTRNFPETVETIRKKYKIADGGTVYAFFSTNLNNEKIVLLCEKISHK